MTRGCCWNLPGLGALPAAHHRRGRSLRRPVPLCAVSNTLALRDGLLRLLLAYQAQANDEPAAEQQVCQWTWGYSFARQAPILVPQACASYGALHRTPQERPFVYEISNGCALGGCLEEAILYGILEVAERDAFLMTWYGRMPVPCLDLSSAADPRRDQH
jgi:thiazole/oxazole-forming peptide maturase SagD family component